MRSGNDTTNRRRKKQFQKAEKMLIDDCQDMVSDDEYFEQKGLNRGKIPRNFIPVDQSRQSQGFREEQLYGSNSYDQHRMHTRFYDLEGKPT